MSSEGHDELPSCSTLPPPSRKRSSTPETHDTVMSAEEERRMEDETAGHHVFEEEGAGGSVGQFQHSSLTMDLFFCSIEGNQQSRVVKSRF